jgi:hypothetical protein
MQEFIAKHQDKIAGTLSGFDRLVFRGHLRSIGPPRGMMTYLWFNQVLLKNFGDHVEKVTERLKAASLAQAKTSGRPIEYLNSSHVDKDTIAHNILARDGVRSGEKTGVAATLWRRCGRFHHPRPTAAAF